jgi:Flp pilus assembly protein CpaB
MQRGRLLILVALVLIILSAAGIFFILRFMQPATPTADGGTPVPSGGGGGVVEQTATPASALNIIVAAQNLKRGDVIPTEALSSFPWPTQIVPPSAITDPSKVVGSRARYTIQRGEPIFSTMIVQSLAQISPSGSDGAGQIPPGFTAISIPYDKRSGVALGVQDGDYVNVLVSWAIVDIDQDFQSVLPNLAAGVVDAEGTGASDGQGNVTVNNSKTGIVYGTGPQANAVGRVETEPNLNLPFYLVPQEEQRSRLVSQAVIQNALVLKVGDFGPARAEVIEPTPTAAPPDPNATATPPPPPTPTPLPPDIITLVVSPQDAIVLDFVNRLKQQYPSAVNVTLTLRSAGDTSLAETQSVTLQYMFERYTISLPAKLNYGLDSKVPAPTPAPAP